MKIDYLAENTQYIETISDWLFKQWGVHYPEKTKEDYLSSVEKRLNKKSVPLTFVALKKENPVGTASLIKHDMDDHKHLSPWLADVFVSSKNRGKGIGTKLVKRVMEKASQMGLERIFLFTRDAKDFYMELGWEEMKKVRYHGDLVDIMYFDC